MRFASLGQDLRHTGNAVAVEYVTRRRVRVNSIGAFNKPSLKTAVAIQGQ